MTWEKLNFLVPDPQCQTKDGVIVNWTDSRPQPSTAEITAVNMDDILLLEKATRNDQIHFEGATRKMARHQFSLENRVRSLEGKGPITWDFFIDKIRQE